MNEEHEIKAGISVAINEKDENKYLKSVMKALTYYLNDKLSIIFLDSLGAYYIPYMQISKKAEKILGNIAMLETLDNPKEEARNCLNSLKKLVM